MQKHTLNIHTKLYAQPTYCTLKAFNCRTNGSLQLNNTQAIIKSLKST